MRARQLSVVSGLLVVGCGGSGSTPPPDWGTAKAVHGFAYYDDTPEGTALRALVSADEPQLCSLFDGKREALSLRYLRVEVRGVKSGSYEVSTDGGQAEVSLIEAVEGRTVSRLRGTGRVDLAVSADGTGDATFAIDVQMPESVSQEVMCEGEASELNDEVTSSCFCRRPDGTTFRCMQANGNDACCERDASGSQALKLTVSSAYCPELCSQVVGLRRCEAPR